jgi:predicted  nucleic acid-binding Zn-ribbon protein
MTAKMETLGNKQATEEIRVRENFEALEKSQTTLGATLGTLVDVINNVKKEMTALQEGINASRNETRKETNELKT